MPTNRAATIPLNREEPPDNETRFMRGKPNEELESFIREDSPILVRGPIRIPNNILGAMFRVFRVYEGRAVVVLANGRIHEVLYAGGYHALSFPMTKRIDVYSVNMRERTLDIETKDEFTLFYVTPTGEKLPVKVDLDMAVTYQVANPERVTVEVDRPITMLYDAVLESIRSIVSSYGKYHDFLSGGQGGHMVLQQLQNRGVEEILGLRVANVQITRLAGAEELDQMFLSGFIKEQTAGVDAKAEAIKQRNQLALDLERAVNDRDIARLTELTPQYVLQHRPDLYPQLFGDRAQTDALRMQSLMEIFKLNPALGSAGGGSFQEALQYMLTGTVSTPTSTSSVHPPSLPRPPLGAAARLQEEVRILQANGLGNNISLREDTGVYYVTVNLQNNQGETLNLYFMCSPQYPHEAPSMFLEYNGQETNYQPDMLTNWSPTSSSLAALVDSVITAYS
ncbi:SPFH/Band 7/PHB domain protein [bacterium]|nr:SPFH/Band 7/PHB domain protein [bacterium]